jgi:hypothetical protein
VGKEACIPADLSVVRVANQRSFGVKERVRSVLVWASIGYESSPAALDPCRGVMGSG